MRLSAIRCQMSFSRKVLIGFHLDQLTAASPAGRGTSGPISLRSICFHGDLDPRWVIKLLKMGQPRMAEEHKQHDRTRPDSASRAHDNIQCLFTTPKLLEALCEKVSLKKMGITGVFCGGTEMTPQFHRFAVEELLRAHTLHRRTAIR